MSPVASLSMTAAFGTEFAPVMASSNFNVDGFDLPRLHPLADLSLHPGAHALHYGSACFEGLKAHRGGGGESRIFRVDRHAARLAQSALLLCLPVPPIDLTIEMVEQVVKANRDSIPSPPGSLYLRPTLIGTEANIGAAGSPPAEGLLYVLASPVGDYFSGGIRPLKVMIEDQVRRSIPGFGMVKTGANYAAALRTVVSARESFGADQVLFAPDGFVEETGASNFLLISDERVVTPPLSDSYLHGVTRDSTLALAAGLGYQVEERPVTVDEVVNWQGEAALSGTAAVLSGVGTVIHRGEEIAINAGEVGTNTLRLRQALTDIQTGQTEDSFGWVRVV